MMRIGDKTQSEKRDWRQVQFIFSSVENNKFVFSKSRKTKAKTKESSFPNFFVCEVKVKFLFWIKQKVKKTKIKSSGTKNKLNINKILGFFYSFANFNMKKMSKSKNVKKGKVNFEEETWNLKKLWLTTWV